MRLDTKLYIRIGDRAWDRVCKEVWYPIMDQIGDEVERVLRLQVWRMVSGEMGNLAWWGGEITTPLRLGVRDQIRGMHD